MRFARAFMPAFANDPVVVHNDAAYRGIGIGPPEPVLRQLYAAIHVFFMYLHKAKVVIFEFMIKTINYFIQWINILD